MTTLKEQVQTPLSRDAAFAYVADFARQAEWDPNTVSSRRIDDGELGVGARFALEVRMGRRSSVMEYRITEYAPPGRVVLIGEGSGIWTQDTITFTEVEHGTRVDYVADIRLGGIPGSRAAAPRSCLRCHRQGRRRRDEARAGPAGGVRLGRGRKAVWSRSPPTIRALGGAGWRRTMEAHGRQPTCHDRGRPALHRGGPDRHDHDRLRRDARAVPPHRPAGLVRPGRGSGVQRRLHGQRAFPSVDTPAGPVLVRMVVHGRPGDRDQPPVRDRGDLPRVPVSPGRHRPRRSHAGRHVPRSLLARAGRWRGAQ